MSGIDLNRAGTGLLEIVSAPDLRSAAEAGAYMRKIHALVRYLEICDGNMQEGSFRCDANVSVRRRGETKLGTRTELKNLNSFRFVEKAIEIEAARQIELIEGGGKVVQETRLFDPDREETRPMRSKEEANDYRYFPDPDLLPVTIDEQLIARVRASLPELPDAKRERFVRDYALPAYDAGVLTVERPLADYFEAVAKATKATPKIAANWVMGELAGALNRDGLGVGAARVSAATLAALLDKIAAGTISGKIAKEVFEALWERRRHRRRDHREARARPNFGLREHRQARGRSHRSKRGAGRAVPCRQAAGARLPRRSGHEGLARQSEPAAGQRRAAQAARCTRERGANLRARGLRHPRRARAPEGDLATGRRGARLPARGSHAARRRRRLDAAARERSQDDTERVAATARRRTAEAALDSVHRRSTRARHGVVQSGARECAAARQRPSRRQSRYRQTERLLPRHRAALEREARRMPRVVLRAVGAADDSPRPAQRRAARRRSIAASVAGPRRGARSRRVRDGGRLRGDRLGRRADGLAAEQLLPKLFAGQAIRLFAARPVAHDCRCTPERLAGVVRMLGDDEVKSLLAEQGHVELKCEFCNRAFRYDDVQVGAIMRGTAQASSAVH